MIGISVLSASSTFSTAGRITGLPGTMATVKGNDKTPVK